MPQLANGPLRVKELHFNYKSSRIWYNWKQAILAHFWCLLAFVAVGVCQLEIGSLEFEVQVFFRSELNELFTPYCLIIAAPIG